MSNFLRAEMLKQKHCFHRKLIWLSPVLTVLLVIAMMAGSHVQDGAYNWWYTILLPGSFTMFVAFGTAGECRKNRHGLFGIAIQKKKLWLSQIIFYVISLSVSCFIFFVVSTIGGLLFGATLGFMQSASASVILCITFAWQIPLWMAVTEKMGKFTAIFFSLFCNFGIAVILAVKDMWWMPFSIPARLMCAVIGVLPNGLQVEAGSTLASPTVILPGMLITIVLFIISSVVTSSWFEKREV